MRRAAESDRRVALLYDDIPHHGAHSGYRSIAAQLERHGCRSVTHRSVSRFAHPAVDRLVRPPGMPWYRLPSLALELSAGARLVQRNPWVCHFLGGEGAYHLLGRARRAGVPLPGKIVCTFHQPPARFDQTVGHRTPLDQLDAAVVLSRAQAAHIAQRMDPARVHVHALHVDSEFFRPPPPERPRDARRLLCIGGWLRDYATLESAVHRLAVLEPEVRFTVLARPELVPRLVDLPTVELVQNLSDAQLRQAYQSAAALVLPLNDAAANNALLEAMACGLPVIATDIGGVRDYVPDDAGILIGPHDPDAIAEAAVRLLADPNRSAALGRGGRRRALELSPQTAAAKLLALYDELAGDPGRPRRR